MATNFWGGNNTAEFLTTEVKVDGMLVKKTVSGNTSTGILEGGALSVGAPNTTFSIVDGSGFVVDAHTDPTDIQATPVSWTGLTNIAVSNFAQPSTFVGIDSTGAVVQQSGQFTTAQNRDIISLGVLTHIGGTFVEAASSSAHFLGNPLTQTSDLADFLGPITTGNIYGANGANLFLDKSSGESLVIGGNTQTDRKNPNVIASGGQTNLSWFYNYQDGVGGFTIVPFISSVDTLNYDDGSGTLAVLNNNRWATQRIYFSAQSGVTIIQYGQEEYTTLASAEASILSETFNKNPLLNGVPLRGWMILKKSGAALNDPLLAKFIAAGKLGESAAGGTTSSTTTLQVAYNNSDEPEITLNSTNGAMSTADNLTPLVGNLTEVTDSTGAIKYNEISAARNQITDADGTFIVRKEIDVQHIDDFKVVAPSTLYTLTGLNSAIVDYTAAPIDGHQSARYNSTNVLDVGGEIIGETYTSLKPIDFETQGINLDWQNNGVIDSVSLIVEESTDNITFTANEEMFLPVSITPRKVKLNFKLSSATTHYRYKFLVNDASVFFQFMWDNLKILTNPNPTAETVQSGYYEISQAQASMLDTTGEVQFNGATATIEERDSFSDMFTVDHSVSPSTWTAKGNFNLVVYSMGQPPLTNYQACFLIDGVAKAFGQAIYTNSGEMAASAPLNIKTGEVLTFSTATSRAAPTGGSLVNNASIYRALITAQASSLATIFQGRTKDALFDNVIGGGVTGTGGGYSINSEGIAGTFTVVRTNSGRSTVSYAGLGLTQAPKVLATNETVSASTSTIRVSNETATSFDVVQTSSGAYQDFNYNFRIEKQGADRVSVEDTVFTVAGVTQEHITGGTEYRVSGESWDGKAIYAKSFEVASVATGAITIGTIDTGLEVIELKYTFNSSLGNRTTSGYLSSADNTVEQQAHYNDATGDIVFESTGGSTATEVKVTIRYL